jgi:hypothetical protein
MAELMSRVHGVLENSGYNDAILASEMAQRDTMPVIAERFSRLVAKTPSAPGIVRREVNITVLALQGNFRCFRSEATLKEALCAALDTRRPILEVDISGLSIGKGVSSELARVLEGAESLIAINTEFADDTLDTVVIPTANWLLRMRLSGLDLCATSLILLESTLGKRSGSPMSLDLTDSTGATGPLSALISSSGLSELLLVRWMIGGEFARAVADGLAKTKTLLRLSIEESDIGITEGALIFEQLRVCNTLKNFSIKGCNDVGKAELDTLANAVSENAALTELNFTVKSHSYHCDLLVASLEKNKTLKTLHLCGGSLSPKGYEELARVLNRDESALTELSIKNSCIMGSPHISFLESLRNLSILDLKKNHPLSPKEAKCITGTPCCAGRKLYINVRFYSYTMKEWSETVIQEYLDYFGTLLGSAENPFCHFGAVLPRKGTFNLSKLGDGIQAAKPKLSSLMVSSVTLLEAKRLITDIDDLYVKVDIFDKDDDYIVQRIKANAYIRFRLSVVMISCKNMCSIFKSIGESTSITDLNVYYDHVLVERYALTGVEHMLKCNTSLKKFTIERGRPRVPIHTFIARGLATNVTLETLRVVDNENVYELNNMIFSSEESIEEIKKASKTVRAVFITEDEGEWW